MSRTLKVMAAAIAACALTAQQASAQIVEATFTGQVTHVSGSPFGIAAAMGDPITVTASYDRSVLDTVGSATFGQYPQSLPDGFTFAIGSRVLKTSGYTAFVALGPPNGFSVAANAMFSVDGVPYSRIGDSHTRMDITLNNPTADSFPTDALPAGFDIAKHTDQNNVIQQSPASSGLTIFQSISFRLDTAVFVSNRDPLADAGDDIVTECAGGLTTVALDGSGSSDPDGDDLVFEWSVPAESGAVLDDPSSPSPTGQFPAGPTLVTLTVTDGNGGIAVDDVLVTVVDTTPPVLVLTTDVIALWQPNHQMRPVKIAIAVSDNCAMPEDLLLYCTASSSETDDGSGDGTTTGDVNGSDGFTSPVAITDLTYDPDLGAYTTTILLRAERDGAAAGRVYSIVCDVLDLDGNSSTASCVVVVPHDKRKK